jgi:hypothetical protein
MDIMNVIILGMSFLLVLLVCWCVLEPFLSRAEESAAGSGSRNEEDAGPSPFQRQG